MANTNYLSDQTTVFSSDVSLSRNFLAANITGSTVAGSALSVTAAYGGVKSAATTGSATSATVGDGELAIMESTNTNATLIFRSGNTTYHWVSSNGSVG